MPRKVLTAVASEPHQGGAIQVEVTLTVRQRRGERSTPNDEAGRSSACPRIPRITRLMALAIKFEDMVERGDVKDYADLARLGYVTRARMTQIMNLLMLAPDIQEQLLSSDDVPQCLRERLVRGLCAQVWWTTQRQGWKALLAAATSGRVSERQ